ncbi:YbaB/EbfC family nucleoid-associated protein [bacterium]|jgi:DNA-binding YbaB/EbfC family protein|nr:YbaB/EbfC family nucleoid-associated protein [bacterium]
MFNKGNMTQLLKQARDVQKKIEEVQNELDDLTIEGDSGGGMVKVVVNGKQQLLELTIDQDAIKEDKELLEDLIISAVNNALTKSLEESQNRMNAVTGNMLGGMNIPGLG